jgi:predicted nucleic acid-binding protein
VKWLLDTSSLSELNKPRPFEGFIRWLQTNEQLCAVSVLSIGEIVLGIEQMPEGKRRRSVERYLKFLREDFVGQTLDFTEGTAVEWGRLVAAAGTRGRNLPVIDSQIEATAIHFGLIVVTRNARDFFYPVFNPWEQPDSR